MGIRSIISNIFRITILALILLVALHFTGGPSSDNTLPQPFSEQNDPSSDDSLPQATSVQKPLPQQATPEPTYIQIDSVDSSALGSTVEIYKPINGVMNTDDKRSVERYIGNVGNVPLKFQILPSDLHPFYTKDGEKSLIIDVVLTKEGYIPGEYTNIWGANGPEPGKTYYLKAWMRPISDSDGSLRNMGGWE